MILIGAKFFFLLTISKANLESGILQLPQDLEITDAYNLLRTMFCKSTCFIFHDNSYLFNKGDLISEYFLL